ncbi:MAG: hypothetical protein LBP22_05455 [Deltaproteobacteria bacterium]|jgi:hypothetical protein|nr:hypothetical protein [Deltaproteobacteria bacterium]
MAIILRIILFFVLFYLIIWVGRDLFRPKVQPHNSDDTRELVRDALSGVYFAKDKAFTLTTDGQTLYFLSQANRDTWLAKRSQLQ